MAREVLPHVADAWVDYDKTKVGYEIPINRHFYVYKPPRPLAQIEADITKLEGEIAGLLEGTRRVSDQFNRQWLSDLPPEWTEKRADFLSNPYRVAVNPEVFGDNLVAHYSIPYVQETGGPFIEPASDIDSNKLLIEAPTLLVPKLIQESNNLYR